MKSGLSLFAILLLGLFVPGIGLSGALSEPVTGKGAKHWAYQSLAKVNPPAAGDWSAHPVDRFIMAGLQKHGLRPNPPADRRTLLRRVYFDLTGLPPTPEQTRSFLADQSPGAFEKVVESLLASPQYGERWGRHWLDAARYADTSGDGADAPVPEAHLYRDYVIESFNRDLPYDQFIVEQIAGDLLTPREPGVRERERIIATGFVAVTRRFNNGEYADMHLVIENTLSTIGKGMLGLSIGCARCHDHKYDPISTQDYYGLYGYFASTQYPHAGTEQGRARKNFVPLPGGGIAWAVTDKKQAADIGDAAIQIRGEPRNLGERVPRGFLAVIGKDMPQIKEGESGRLELARWIASPENPLTSRVVVNRIWQHHFGRGIVETADNFGKQGLPPSHPELLDWLAREFVAGGWSFKQLHRLILSSQTWQQSSVADEAMMNLDPVNHWLWRFPVQRLDAEAIRDAALLVAGRLKLESGGAPPFPQPNEKNEYPYTQHRPFLKDYDHELRSVYLPSRRLGKHPYMELFDGPDPNECTARRRVSTVPLQALFWMNSDFIRDNARAMAKRLLADASDDRLRLTRAYEAAFNRLPTEDELRSMTEYLTAYQAEIAGESDPADRNRRAWTSVCRLLLSANEFIYVD